MNFELMCEVISLSHRFGINELIDIASTMACSKVTMDNCSRLYLMFNLYDTYMLDECLHKRAMFLFTVRCLGRVSRLDDFKNVSIEDLKRFVISQEAIVSEIDLHNAIEY